MWMSDQILIQLCILQTNQKCLGFTFFSLHFSQLSEKKKEKSAVTELSGQTLKSTNVFTAGCQKENSL